jgi:hypothetical protein
LSQSYGGAGTFVYNPQSGQVYRLGRSGGQRHPTTGAVGQYGTLQDLPADLQAAFLAQQQQMDALLHPPEPEPFEFPEITMPEFKFPEQTFPDFTATQKAQAAEAAAAELEESQAKTRKTEAFRRGRRRTILTGPQGLITPAPTGRKTLLGE